MMVVAILDFNWTASKARKCFATEARKTRKFYCVLNN